MKKIIILNITHGDNPYMDKPPFLSIAAGACRSDITNDACGDDNISAKNKWYGDFSSLYWAWKNLKDVDIFGTSHYRRYLSNIEDSNVHTYYKTWKEFYGEQYDVTKFQEDLETYDFIMSSPVDLDCTVREQYLSCHPYPEHLDMVGNVLRLTHPEALPIWEKYLNEHVFRIGYLFVTKWQDFDDLCSWLYPILKRCEEEIGRSNFDGCQERVVAFLYERLVPVYMETYGKKIKYYPMCYITSDQPWVYYQRDENERLYLTYKKQYESLINSKAYRLGKKLLKPYSWIKRFL